MIIGLNKLVLRHSWNTICENFKIQDGGHFFPRWQPILHFRHVCLNVYDFDDFDLYLYYFVYAEVI